jgi:hypothetical protein
VYFWVDGIHVQARLEGAAQCLLVIIGATPEGKKEQRDPKLQSHDRQKLQAELARGILETLKTGERDLLHISNRAIRQLRERMLMADRRSAIRK